MLENIKQNPKDQRSLFNLGNWFLSQSEFKKAIKYYKRAYKLTPSNDEKYFIKAQIGIAHQLLGNDFRALWTFNSLEKLIPNRWETKRLRGGIHLQAGSYKKAVECFVLCLEPNKEHYLYEPFGHDLAELWDLIAACFYELGQPAKAVIAEHEAMKHTKDKTRLSFFQTKINLFKMLVPNQKINEAVAYEMTPVLSRRS
jgi:tetratricopeptide (TPR) repeat protein